MRAVPVLVLMLVVLTSGAAWAQSGRGAPAPPPSTTPAQAETPAISLSAARALRCVFPNYVATRWIEGTPETVNGKDELTFEIDTINLKARTARIVGARGSTLVSAFITQTGLNVIEQTPIGNFILTSAFIGGRDGNALRAVHSRHLGDVAELPTPSQYFGTCEILR
jgi:hypothetical protein